MRIHLDDRFAPVERGTVRVTLDGLPATSVQLATDERIDLVLPALTRGMYSVQVDLGGGRLARLEAALCVACGTADAGSSDAGSLPGVPLDAALDAASDAFPPPGVDSGRVPDGGLPPLDERPFGEPTPIAALESNDSDDDPTLTNDLLELYFESRRNGGTANIYVSRRSSVEEAWGAPSRVDELSSGGHDVAPRVSGNGLSIVITRPNGNHADLYLSTRAGRDDPWSPPEPMDGINTGAWEQGGVVDADGMRAFFEVAAGSSNLWTSLRASLDDDWESPVPLDSLNGPFNDRDPFPHATGRLLLFSSERTGGGDLYAVARQPGTLSFGEPVLLEGVNTAATEESPWLSPDGSYLVFSSDRSGDEAIYEARRP